jgi:hypothetical protein
MSTIVRLDRSTDRERPCCENLATLRPGKGPHGAELRCAGCDRHRGWLPKQAVDFLAAIADRLGDPDPNHSSRSNQKRPQGARAVGCESHRAPARVRFWRLNRGRLRFGLRVGGCRCQSLRAVGSVISGIYLDRVLLDCIGLQFYAPIRVVELLQDEVSYVTRRFLRGDLLAD